MQTADMSIPAPLTATLVMSPEQYATLQRERTALEVAHAYTIEGTTEEQQVLAQEANNELKSVKARIEAITKQREGFLTPARTIMENANNLFNPALTALAGCETFLKMQLIAYRQREDKRIADEKRVLEDAARAARQKAEQEAAIARGRAEQEARERQRQADVAEEERRKAEAEGNAKAAKEAAARKAKAEEQARSAIETGEAKAQAAQLTASAAQYEAPATVKIQGFSTRDSWAAELAPATTEDQALVLIVNAIAAGRLDLLALVKLDMKAANKLAGALHDKMSVPGLVAKNTPIATSRK